MNKGKIIAIILIIVFIILFLFITNFSQIKKIAFEAKKMIYEDLLNQEIIDLTTGEINNNFFNIDDTCKQECTEGINEEIQ